MYKPLYRNALLALFTAAALVATCLKAAEPAADPTERRPVIVELFTSEGCSSCPPADRLLEKLAREQPVDGAEIIPLAFHVDYWNYLGWKDEFSSPEFTDRQRAYADLFGSDHIYTPQMIVDGRREFVGSSSEKADRAIRAASAAPKPPLRLNLHKNGEEVEVEIAMSGTMFEGSELVAIAAVTEDDISTQVRRGENAGRQLNHWGVVRGLEAIPTTREAEEVKGRKNIPLQPAWEAENLSVVAIIQDLATGEILAAARTRVP